MTSGEGGMVLTSDAHLASNIRRFNSLGYGAVAAGAGEGKISKEKIQDPSYERHVSVGWNYRMPELCAAVALGQLERLNELVDARIRVANLYKEAVRGCNWLIPQFVPEGYVHSYWTYVLKIQNDAPANWHDFRKKFIEMGGDGIYGSWQLTYLEPAFLGKHNVFRKQAQITDQIQPYQSGLCPIAESIQPRLLQLKTNYINMDLAKKKADALFKAINFWNK